MLLRAVLQAAGVLTSAAPVERVGGQPGPTKDALNGPFAQSYHLGSADFDARLG